MRYFDRRQMTKPELLLSTDVESRRRDIADYIGSVNSKGGQRRAPAYQDVLENTQLVEDVRQSFQNVCAYCERPTEMNGQVFHHRPPGLAADQADRTELLNYVWLTYDWENLYWVCDTCVRCKANRFYARNPTHQTIADIGNLRQTEGELLLDPCFHEFHNHLDFRPDGRVFGLTDAGRATVDLLHLDAIDLQLVRRHTGHDLVTLLRKKHLAVPVPTGLATGMANALLAERKPGGGAAQLLPFIGGATLALLNWFGQRGLDVDDCRSLLYVLNDTLSLQEGQKLLDAYELAIEETGVKKEQASDFTDMLSKELKVGKALGSWDRLFRPADTALSDARIHTINIRNYKALKSVDLTLPSSVPHSLVPCAVILGENATGKSSVLEAVTLALLGTSETNLLMDYLKPRSEDISPKAMVHRPDTDNWDVLSTEPLDVTISYLGCTQTSHLSAAADSPNYGGDPRPSKILLAYGPRRFFSKQSTRRYRAPLYRVRSLFDPLATLPHPANWLIGCDDKKFHAVVRALREVLMLDAEADVTRDPEKQRIMIETAQGLTPLSSLSEGYKSVVAMATDIARELLTHYDNLENAYAVVLIDEIETHLHPRWKLQIVQRLRRAFPRVQFIITTHDPLCLRGMYDGEVFVLQRDPVNRRVETLTNLPDVRGMRAEQILTSEFFGLGSTDPETDAKLMRYQMLQLNDHQTAAEAAEMDRLHDEITRTMKIGDTIQEQVLNEAFSKAAIDPLAPIGKVGGKSRQDMVGELLSVITDIQQGHIERDAGLETEA